MRLSHLLVMICITGSVLSLISCADPQPIDPQTFKLVIMQGGESCDYKKMVLDSNSYWPALIESYPDFVVHTITQEGIKSYNWGTQNITLTEQESEIFTEVTKDWEFKVFSPEGGSTEFCHFTFLVFINDEPIYGGLILNPYSQMPINYPVIYTSQYMSVTSISFHPSIFPVDLDDSSWKMIKDKRIKKIFESAGKLID
jgi:hypothetical protein